MKFRAALELEFALDVPVSDNIQTIYACQSRAQLRTKNQNIKTVLLINLTVHESRYSLFSHFSFHQAVKLPWLPGSFTLSLPFPRRTSALPQSKPLVLNPICSTPSQIPLKRPQPTADREPRKQRRTYRISQCHPPIPHPQWPRPNHHKRPPPPAPTALAPYALNATPAN